MDNWQAGKFYNEGELINSRVVVDDGWVMWRGYPLMNKKANE